MTRALDIFIETVNTQLVILAFTTNPVRQERETARLRRQEALRRGERPALPTTSGMRLGDRNGMRHLDPVEAAVNSAADAIFEAESVFAEACSRELADGGQDALPLVLSQRSAGDAVLRFAGAALRAYGIYADKYTRLGRLVSFAERLPDTETEDDERIRRRSPFAPRLVPDPSPGLASRAYASPI